MLGEGGCRPFFSSSEAVISPLDIEIVFVLFSSLDEYIYTWDYDWMFSTSVCNLLLDTLLMLIALVSALYPEDSLFQKYTQEFMIGRLVLSFHINELSLIRLWLEIGISEQNTETIIGWITAPFKINKTQQQQQR